MTAETTTAPPTAKLSAAQIEHRLASRFAPQANFSGAALVTDTRKLSPGCVFVAFSGENFDAHDFLKEAEQKGAVAAIVERQVEQVNLPQLIVPNTRRAFGHLASAHRSSFDELTVIAITGSSGKTTVKEMLGSILSQLAPTLITEGNLNNDLGVPMMLLRLTQAHRYAVLELGANHQGEIDYTAKLAKPDIAGVLNIGTAHVGEFGSQAIIAQSKAEIYDSLSETGIAVLPEQTAHQETLNKAASSHTSMQAGTQLYLKDQQQGPFVSRFSLCTESKQAPVTLHFSGEHNVQNALMAATLAYAAGVKLDQIATGLSLARPANGRLEVTQLGQLTLIDDTYNANFEAALAAAKTLSSTKEDPSMQAIMVLGDIGELGDQSEQIHSELGVVISQLALDQLVTFGTLSRFTSISSAQHNLKSQHFDEINSLIDYLCAQIDEHGAKQPSGILVKGSRYMQMERVIQTLTQRYQQRT